MQKAYIFSTLNGELQFDDYGIRTTDITYDLDDDKYNGIFQPSQNLNFTIKELPENFDQILYTAKYNVANKEWALEDKKIQGEFYQKTTGIKFTEIFAKDVELYTDIIPLPSYDDGTTQVFDDATQTWEYAYKGLAIQKQEKLQILEQKHNESKTITIQNGEMLIIKYDTPERKYFIQHLSITENLQQDDRRYAIKSYQQDVGDQLYQIDMYNEIWQFMFKDIFKIEQNGGLIDIIAHNQLENNIYTKKINNAKTVEELNNITIQFIPIPTIDINKKALELLANPNISQQAKNAIEHKRDPNNPNQFHLIKVI